MGFVVFAHIPLPGEKAGNRERDGDPRFTIHLFILSERLESGRNGVVTTSAPRVTPQNAAYSEEGSLHRAVCAQGLEEIMRTGGAISATATGPANHL